jgi:hypothetical protein
MVYVFGRDVGGKDNWGHVDTIVPVRAEPYGSFGRSLAIEEDLLVVASRQTVDLLRPVGRAGTWMAVAALEPTAPNTNSFRAPSVAVRNGRVAVADPRLDDGPLNFVGGVFLFVPDSIGSWTQEAVLRPDDPSESQYLGWSVGIGNDIVVAGSVNADNNELDAGAVYVFKDTAVFGDGFESGDTSAWSNTQY